jgi:hypothetical protein
MTPNEGQQLAIESRDRELPDNHWNRVYTDPDYFGEFAKRPAIQTGASLSPFPETYAKRQANIAYLSSSLEIPAEEMPAIYEAKKNEIGKTALQTPTLSDEGLFNYFKKQFDRENEVNTAADGIYQEVQKSVFQGLFDSQAGTDITGQPAYRPLLEQKLTEAGEILSDEDRLRIRENADKMADNLRRANDSIGDEARWLFDIVSKQTGRGQEYELAGEQPNPAGTVGGLGPVMNLAVKQPEAAPAGEVDLNDPEMLNFQTEQILEKFADMPTERRQSIYLLAGAFAELNQVNKGVFYQAAETLGRFLTREMGERISRNFTEESIRGQQRLLQSDLPLYEATNLDGSKGLSQAPTSGQAPITAEQREKLKADAARKLKILQIKRELVNLADTQIDPIKVVTDWPTWEQGFYGFVGSIPYAGIAAIPFVGFPAITASFFGQYKDDLLLEYPDMDPDQAAAISALAAPMAAGLELIQANLVMGRFVSLDRAIKFFLKPSRNPMTRIIARGTASFGMETGIELSQNRVLPILQTLGAALSDDIPDYDWRKDLEAFDEELGVTAVTMLLFTLTGLPFITSQEIGRNAAYLQDKKMLKYFGMSEEQADRVSTSLTKKERVAAFKEAEAARDPALIEAGRRQLFVDTMAQLQEPADPFQPSIRRDGDRFTVLDAEGNTIADRVDVDTAFYEFERIAGSSETLFASVQGELINALLEAGQATNPEGFSEQIQVTTQEVVNRYNNMTPEQLQRRIEQWERETGKKWQPGAAVNLTAVNTLEQIKENLFQSITRVVKATSQEEIRAVLEDRAEGQYKIALQAGQFSEADMVGWIREYEANTGDNILEQDFTSRDVVEAVSTMSVAYYTGNLDNARVSSRLRAFFEALKEYFATIFARGIRIKEAIAAGQIAPEFEAFLAQSVGLDIDRQIGVQAAQQARAEINAGGLVESSFAISPKRNSLRVRMTRQALTDAALSQASWKDWYEEHREVLDEFFGDYAQMFQQILDVTSQAASVKANVGLGLKAFGQWLRGEEFDGFLPAVIMNLNRLRDSAQVQGQKIKAYRASNAGQDDQPVVDRHIARLIFGVDSPTAAQFAKAQQILTEIAAEIGWTPRQVQAALWAHSIVKSGKTPESYGAYLKTLEQRGIVLERIGSFGDRSRGGDGLGGGRGRFAPASTGDGDSRSFSISVSVTAANILADRGGVPGMIPDWVIGKSFVPIEADRTAGGGKFSKMLAQGGPAFAVDPANLGKVVWAARNAGFWRAKLNAARASKAIYVGQDGRKKFLIMPYAMSLEAHTSNTTVVTEKISEIERYVREGRISSQDEAALADGVIEAAQKIIAKSKDQKEINFHKPLTEFPRAFTSQQFDAYIDSLNFEQRAFIADKLSSAKAEKLNAPPMQQIRRATTDPSYAGTPQLSGFSLLEIDVKRLEEGLKNNTLSAADFNVPAHASYNAFAPGRVIAHFRTPIPYELAMPTMRAALAGRGNDGYYLKGRMPIGTPKVQKISKQMASQWATSQTTLVPNQAAAVTAALNKQWRVLDKPRQAGIAEFSRALRNNDAAVTLTLYTPEEINALMKQGKMRIYQLGEMEVYFALKRPDGSEFDPGDPDTEWSIVGVVNNELSAPGMLNLIMSKAISEGGTRLDCYKVVSGKYPNGLLPSLYARFGFEEQKAVDFDPQYHQEPGKISDLRQVWHSQGWSGQTMPQVVWMKWNRESYEQLLQGNDQDATGSLAEIKAEDESRLAGGQGSPAGTGAGEASVGLGGSGSQEQGGGRADGASAPGNAGNAPDLLPRGIASVVSELRSSNDYQLQALGLSRADVDSAVQAYDDAVAAGTPSYSIAPEPDRSGFNEITLPNGNVRFIAYHGSEQALTEVEDRPIYVSSMQDGAGYGTPVRLVVQGRFLPVDDVEEFAKANGIAMEDLFHEEASQEETFQDALKANGFDGAIYYDQRRDDGDVIPAAIVVNPAAVQLESTFAISPASYYGDLESAVAALNSNPAFRRERVAAVLAKFKRIKEQFANKADLEPLSMPEAVAQLEAIITLLPPDAQSEVGGFRRLLSFSTAKGRLNYLTDRIAKADAALEKYLRTELQEDIMDLLERAMPRPGENKVQTSSLGPDAQRVANLAIAAIELGTDETSNTMAEIEAALASPDITPDRQEQLLEQWGVLNALGDFFNRSALELDQARVFLRQTFGAGRAMWRMQQEARRKQYRDMAEELAGGLKKATENQIDKMDKENPWLKNPRQFVLSHYSFMQLLRSVLPKAGFLETWERSIRQAEIGSSRYRMDAAKRFIDMLMAASGKKTSFGVGRLMYDMRKTRKAAVRYKEGYNEKLIRLPMETAANILEGRASAKAFGLNAEAVAKMSEAYLAVPIMRRRTTPSGAVRETPNRQQFLEFYVLQSEGTDDKLNMSPAEAMQLLLAWDQSEVQARMRRQGWTDESIEDMQKMVTSVPGGEATMDFLRREYKAGGDAADPVYMKMFGMAMPRIENYAPTRYRHKDDSNDLSPMGSALELAGTTPGSLKARQRHDARMRRTDAITVFFQHAAQMGHWINFAEINREIRGVLKNQNVRESMEATMGRSGLQIFDQWMDTLAQGGGRRAMELSADKDIWAALISAKSIASLGFSVRTLFMQIDAASRAALDMGLAEYTKTVLDPRWMADMPKAWNSDTVQRRLIEGSRPEVRYVFERAAVRPSMLLWAAQKSMIPMQMTDAALTSFTAAIVYRNAYNKAKKAEASDAMAEQAALDAMDKAVFNYSQPIDITSRSLREVQGNMLQKVYMMFLSDARLKTALFAEAIGQLGKEGERGKGASTISALMIMAVVTQTMANLYRDWFSDEPDDEIWTLEGYAMAMMLAPLSGYMLVGTVGSTVVREAFGEMTFQSTDPANEMIDRGIRSIKGWDNTFNTSDPEAMLKQWNNLLRFASFNPTLAAPAALLNFAKPIVGAMENAENPE